MSVRMSASEATKLLGAQSKQGRSRGVSSKDDRTFDGRVYMSKAEMMKAFELTRMKASGQIADWKPQVAIPMIVTNAATGKQTMVCKMVADFEVTENSGAKYWVEIKGFRTQMFSIKLKLLKALYPDLDYRIVEVK